MVGWGLVYGYTPPTVIAVDPDLLADAGGFQTVAAAMAAEVARRPAWIVVKAAESIVTDDAPAWAMEACLRSPGDLPRDHDDATAEVLRRHLADAGVRLPVVPVPSGPTPHSPASAIVAGTWRDAAAIARLAGAAEVVAWTLEPEWVPEEVEGVPFEPTRPDARVASA